jgi:hypothetical protein
VVADAVLSKAGGVIPVAPVNPRVEQSPPPEATPGVVNHVSPALQAITRAQPQPHEGEPVYTSVPDPVKRDASARQVPHDWTIHKPAAEKVEDPPKKPMSQVLLDNLKSIWTASASAVQVDQVANQLNRPAPTQPTEIAGDLAKQVLTYQPTPIKKNQKV